MKKTILPIFVFLFSIVFSVNPSALTLDSSFGVYSQETVLELPLKANPTSADQSAVSVRLLAKNSEFIDFIPATGENWVGITKDCQEGESYFTSNELCLSLAKSSPLLKDELIGTVKLKVNGIDTAVVSKEEGTKYSNGVDSVEDLGVIAEFYTDGSLKNLSFAVSGPIDESINNTNVIILSVGGLAVFALLVLLFVKRNSLKQLLANKKTRVIVLIVGFGVLVATFAGAAVVINNNQALDESSAAVIQGNMKCPAPYTATGNCSTSVIGFRNCSIQTSNGLETRAILPDPACDPQACNLGGNKFLKSGQSAPCVDGIIMNCRGGTLSKTTCNRDCGFLNLKHGQTSSCTSEGLIYKCDNGKITETKSGCTCTFKSQEILPDRVSCIEGFNRKCVNGNVQTGNACGTTGGGANGGGAGGGTQPPVVAPPVTNPPTTGTGTTTNPPVVNNPPTTTGGGGTTVATCPSTQPRFVVGQDNKNLGLVGGGTFEFSRITNLQAVVVINNDAAQQFTGGVVTLTGPNAQGQIVTLATNTDGRTIAIAKQVGKYTLIATVGSQECARVSIDVTATKTTNPPVIGGDTAPCGNMDQDSDGKLTVLDFAAFAKQFNTKCINTGFAFNSCKSKDKNSDGIIDVVDFASFGLRYNKASCAIQ